MSILYAWVYNNTGRSILAAILLHFMHNLTPNALMPISERADILESTLLLAAAIVVAVV